MANSRKDIIYKIVTIFSFSPLLIYYSIIRGMNIKSHFYALSYVLFSNKKLNILFTNLEYMCLVIGQNISRLY